MAVEVELLKDSQSDVVADTHETPETLAEKPEVKLLGSIPVVRIAQQRTRSI